MSDAEGSVKLALDSLTGVRGVEEAVVVAGAEGWYSIDVVGGKLVGSSPSYRLSVSDQHSATKAEQWRAEAARLYWRARCNHRQGRSAAAAAGYEKAVEFSRRADDRRGEAVASFGLGLLQREHGELALAEAALELAQAAYRELGDRYTAGWVSIDLIEVKRDLSEQREARPLAEEALSIAKEFSDRRLEGKAWMALGSIADELGSGFTAMECFREATDAAEQAGDDPTFAAAASGLGTVLLQAGRPEAALEQFSRAERRATEPQRVHLMQQRGRALRQLRRYEAAIRVLEAALERQRDDDEEVAETLNLLGLIKKEQGDHTEATRLFYEARRRLENLGNSARIASVNVNLGENLQICGRPDEALRHCQRALDIVRDIGRPASEASALYCRAVSEMQLGRLDAALESAEAAISLAEELRGEKASAEDRAWFLAHVRHYYELPVELNMRLEIARPEEGYAEAAFEAIGRARSRTLLDRLRQYLSTPGAVADPAVSERIEELRENLHRLHRELTIHRNNSQQQAELAAEIEEALSEITLLEERALRGSPVYADLLRPDPMSIDEVQETLLADGTQLLVYHLGDEASYLWLIDRDSMVVRQLPSAEVLGYRARTVRDLLAGSSTSVGGQQVQRATEELAERILEPVADLLRGPRLVISPDGGLHQVPFGALPVPGKASDEAQLVDRFTIAYTPSVGVLRALRVLRAERSPATAGMVVIGDPVFSSADVRIGARGGGDPPTIGPADGVARIRAGCTDLVHLPDAGREARAIARLVTDARLRTGFDADRRWVLDDGLSRARWVHFATHACVDRETPELSGIALSMVDRNGDPVDGLLRVHEMVGLDLSADLVVVSACRSALGREVVGEGMQGIARGLLYAGVPQVVVSLWEVGDEATYELMTRFYQEMVEHGRDPAAALAAAQRSMASSEKWSAPEHWAGFVLQGDWLGP